MFDWVFLDLNGHTPHLNKALERGDSQCHCPSQVEVINAWLIPLEYINTLIPDDISK